jgi:molybdopterin synthase catalytic subunit/molybdopterin converting factor small subunit
MRVRVLFFGMLKDLAGRANDSLELPAGARVADVVAHYSAATPRLRDYLGSVAISVNLEYASRDAALHENDEVGLLPPVSGGAGTSSQAPKPDASATSATPHQPGKATPRVAIVRQRIDAEQSMRTIKAPSDGAVAVFDGIVRNNSRGRPTLYLDYEGYEPMALAELEKLAGEALNRFAIREIVVIHRLGRLEIGESSVFIAVASAHRGAAFDACRWTIDTLKKTVPIWKKEYFSDGAVWADGEPFPPEIVPEPR